MPDDCFCPMFSCFDVVEENIMLLNPVEREMRRRGIEEGKLEAALNMIDEGIPMDKIVRITGLSKEDILNAK